MKQLFGANIWIVLISLIVVFVVLSFNLSSKNRYRPVDELPFISISKTDDTNEAFQNLWNTKDATLNFVQDPMFTLAKIADEIIVWNGEKDLLIVNPSSNEIPYVNILNESLSITYKNPQTWLSINRVLHPGLHIEVLISDQGNNKEATMSYYGEKDDKFTLRPELEPYQNAVLVRPIDAIEIEATLFVYFEFAWIENGSDLRIGLIEYSWDGESLLWRVISDNVGFKETGKGSSSTICQNKAWFILLDGSVLSINLDNGELKFRDDISSKLNLSAKAKAKAKIYRYKNALVLYNSLEETGFCSIVVVENNKISCYIQSDKKTVNCYKENKKSMCYDYQPGYLDPYNWVFPTY